MDPTLQRHCAQYIYAIPDGLRELMSDISREVLRSQPEHLYTFIADYLDALLITRENARVAARLVEVVINIGKTIANFLLRTGLTRTEADAIVTKIQTAFRNHLARKKHLKLIEETVEEEQEFLESLMGEIQLADEDLNKAAKIIQNAYRDFKDRESHEKDVLRGVVDWRVAAKSTINLYRKTGVTFEEANRAATLIKAAYKGYYTRHVMKRLLEQGTKEYIESIEETPGEEFEGEGDDDWGWCYCFLEEEEKTSDEAHSSSDEQLSSTVVTSILSSIITTVFSKSNIKEDLEKTEETDAPVEKAAEEVVDDTKKDAAQEAMDQAKDSPHEGTISEEPADKPEEHPDETKDVDHTAEDAVMESPPPGEGDVKPPAEPAAEIQQEGTELQQDAAEIKQEDTEIQQPVEQQEPAEHQQLAEHPEPAEHQEPAEQKDEPETDVNKVEQQEATSPDQGEDTKETES